jgi:hypothetical protein
MKILTLYRKLLNIAVSEFGTVIESGEKHISTFPKHFHNGSEDIVVQSHISENPEIALREFLSFVVKHIQTKQPNGRER